MSHSSSLSPAQLRTLAAILFHGQITASQLRRLLYWKHTPDGAYEVCRRHLERLTRLGKIRRVWTVYAAPGRSAEYLYMPPRSTHRGANEHTLDITELYVRLVELVGHRDFRYDREPEAHVRVGHLVINCDAYLEFDKQTRAFIEVDRGSSVHGERKPQLSEKARMYVQALYEWQRHEDELGPFPRIIFTVPNEHRRTFVLDAIKRIAGQDADVFWVMLFDDAASAIAKFVDN